MTITIPTDDQPARVDFGELVRAVTPIVERRGHVLSKQFHGPTDWGFFDQYGAYGRIAVDGDDVIVEGPLFAGIEPAAALDALDEQRREEQERERARIEAEAAAKRGRRKGNTQEESD